MFKLGILVCDHLHPDLESEFGDYPRMFDELFGPFADELEINYYFVVDEIFPESVDDCDAYMTSGSKSSVNDQSEWIKRLQNFIQKLYQANIPFVGICFGHQLIAKALGGSVEKSSKGWGVGVHNHKLLERKTWMSDDLDNLHLVVSHQDQISKLPAATQVLASSYFCAYGMIQVGECFLGIQGHPEFSRSYSASLMQLRKATIPEKVRNVGGISLNQKTNSFDVAGSIINFIKKSLDGKAN